MLIPNANIKTVPSNGKYIVMSDCHRGDGSAADEFAHNSLIYKCALEYYLKEGFTYIELGDAEELWENDSFEQIYITHTSVYELLHRFHDPDPAKTRYLKVWGNHDADWCDNAAPLRSLFPDIQIHEAILIGGQGFAGSSVPNPPVSPFAKGGRERSAGAKGVREEGVHTEEGVLPILLLHGHQADPICTGLRAKISRYIVRHVWARLQRIGIGDPTRAAENPGRCDEIDKTLYQMATAKIVIAGHTHRPVFANLSLTERRFLESGIGTPGVRRKEKAEPVYYNTGSCVHPRCITGLEITSHNITLAKWGYAAAGAADPPYSLAIARTVLEEGKR
ncbi:MAG: hypothetical protein NT140_00210 [Deltaproteobacteria bacterium]|nr:hypothetical protein [Deltaproteobacteria bacterium]